MFNVPKLHVNYRFEVEEIVVFDSIDTARRVIPDGEKRRVKIGAKKLCLAHYRGKFYAMDDGCPHMGHSLNLGNFNPFGEIVCPLHTYRFNLKTGEEAEQRCTRLKTYRVIEDDRLAIEI